MNKEAENIHRRVFRHEKGDWKTLEKLALDINKQAVEMEKAMNELIKMDIALRESIHAAYHIAPTIDCLFLDSPISPQRQTLYMKMHLKKMGWDGVRDVVMPPSLIADFSKSIKEGCRWLLKFKPNETKS